MRRRAAAALSLASILASADAGATSSAEVTGGNWFDLGTGNWLLIAGAGAVGGLEGLLVYEAASRHEPIAIPWAVTEVAVNVPLTALVGWGLGRLSGERPDPSWSWVVTYPAMSAILALPPALATHGAWSLSNRDRESGTTFSVSYAVGVDAVLTTHAFATALHGRLLTPAMGIGEVLAASPQGIVAWVQAVRDPAHRTEWAALSAWSGALVLHGLFSAALGDASPPAPARVALQPMVSGPSSPVPGLSLVGIW